MTRHVSRMAFKAFDFGVGAVSGRPRLLLEVATGRDGMTDAV